MLFGFGKKRAGKNKRSKAPAYRGDDYSVRLNGADDDYTVGACGDMNDHTVAMDDNTVACDECTVGMDDEMTVGM